MVVLLVQTGMVYEQVTEPEHLLFIATIVSIDYCYRELYLLDR